MNTKLLLTAAASAVAITGVAAAQTYEEPTPYVDEAAGFYLGGGYTWVDIETDSDIDAFDDVGDSTNAFTARAGYQFTPVFSAEIEGTFGFDDGSFDLDGDEIDLDDIDIDDIGDDIDGENLDSALANGGDVGLDYLVGAFGRVGFPVNERFTVSGRVGYAFAEIDVTNTTEFTTIDDGGTADDDSDDVTTVTTQSRSVGGSDDGFAFGASARYNFSGASAVRADYTRYNFGDANADAITISYQHTFGGPGVGY